MRRVLLWTTAVSAMSAVDGCSQMAEVMLSIEVSLLLVVTVVVLVYVCRIYGNTRQTNCKLTSYDVNRRHRELEAIPTVPFNGRSPQSQRKPIAWPNIALNDPQTGRHSMEECESFGGDREAERVPSDGQRASGTTETVVPVVVHSNGANGMKGDASDGKTTLSSIKSANLLKSLKRAKPPRKNRLNRKQILVKRPDSVQSEPIKSNEEPKSYRFKSRIIEGCDRRPNGPNGGLNCGTFRIANQSRDNSRTLNARQVDAIIDEAFDSLIVSINSK